MSKQTAAPAITFGTEGWRAVISDGFTFANVRLVAQAIADYYRGHARGGRGFVIGYDTRFLSSAYAQQVAEVFAANGLSVILATRPAPTCAVSRIIVDQRLRAGIMITASHNPPQFNGIKIKESFGGSADPVVTEAVERLIGAHPVRSMALDDAERAGRVQRADVLPGYLRGITSYVDLKAIKRTPLRVLVDSMHGVGDGLIAHVLRGGRCRVTTMRGEPDATFGGTPPEPIPQYLTELLRQMHGRRYALGIANDGDADRIGAATPQGKFLSPGMILSLLLIFFLEERGWTGEVVTSISNTSLISRVVAKYNLTLHETPVGFKHIAALIRQRDILIGGEESGGIGVKHYLPERDGVLLGLLLLELLAKRRRSMRQLVGALEKEFGAFYYQRQDLQYPDALKPKLFRWLKTQTPTALDGQPVDDVQTSDGVKLIARDGSWLLYRLSGTEPILRIYAEGTTRARARKILAQGEAWAAQFHA